MKCYEGNCLPLSRHSFNYSLIRTRCVVEQAFGRLKGWWKVMDGHCNANDPVFVRQVAIVCCGLHNVCERHPCPFEPGWLPDPSAYVDCCCSVADMADSFQSLFLLLFSIETPSPPPSHLCIMLHLPSLQTFLHVCHSK